MPGAELVSHIRIDAMDALRSEEKPVLAACIRDDLDYHTTLEGLETVAIYAGPALRICVILEDLLPFFESRYGVTGTPTFLLLQGGELKDSLMGKSSVQTLMDFVMPFIQGKAKDGTRRAENAGKTQPAAGRKRPHDMSSLARTGKKRGAL